MTSIGLSAFQGSGLETLEITGSNTFLDFYAFADCVNLQSVFIQNFSAGENVFENCVNLTNVRIVEAIDIPWSSFDGCTSLSLISIPSTVKNIGVAAFQNCYSLEAITLPPNCTLQARAFAGSGLISVTIPNIGTSSLSMVQLYEGTFMGCEKLETVEILNIDNLIPKDTFRDCPALETVNMPQKSPSTITIGESAFSGCFSLANISIPSNVTQIGAEAFAECMLLEGLSIPANVATIGENAFLDIPWITYLGSATGSPWGAENHHTGGHSGDKV